MAEYIEREALFQSIRNLASKSSLGETALPCLDWKEIVSAISDMPVADVAPVKRGFWKPISESKMTGFNPKFAGRDPIAGYKCSNCGNEAIFSCNDEFVLSDYCPNCGAKMDGEEE